MGDDHVEMVHDAGSPQRSDDDPCWDEREYRIDPFYLACHGAVKILVVRTAEIRVPPATKGVCSVMICASVGHAVVGMCMCMCIACACVQGAGGKREQEQEKKRGRRPLLRSATARLGTSVSTEYLGTTAARGRGTLTAAPRGSTTLQVQAASSPPLSGPTQRGNRHERTTPRLASALGPPTSLSPALRAQCQRTWRSHLRQKRPKAPVRQYARWRPTLE